MSHGDKVTALPPGFTLMASTPSCPIAGMADDARRFYGVQFHPEVTHTRQGAAILERFVRGICGATPDWVMRDHVAEAVAAIRAQVGGEEVILGLSGGVDSSVAAALIHRAIGDQLTCVFVDHGLLRQDEARLVMEMFAGRLHARVVHVDASAQFLDQLAGVTDPGAEAQDHRPRVHRGVQGRSGEAQGRRRRSPGRDVPGAGHDLPGRHRIRAAPRRRRPSPSRATTTSAACRPSWD